MPTILYLRIRFCTEGAAFFSQACPKSHSSETASTVSRGFWEAMYHRGGGEGLLCHSTRPMPILFCPIQEETGRPTYILFTRRGRLLRLKQKLFVNSALNAPRTGLHQTTQNEHWEQGIVQNSTPHTTLRASGAHEALPRGNGRVILSMRRCSLRVVIEVRLCTRQALNFPLSHITRLPLTALFVGQRIWLGTFSWSPSLLCVCRPASGA